MTKVDLLTAVHDVFCNVVERNSRFIGERGEFIAALNIVI